MIYKIGDALFNFFWTLFSGLLLLPIMVLVILAEAIERAIQTFKEEEEK